MNGWELVFNILFSLMPMNTTPGMAFRQANLPQESYVCFVNGSATQDVSLCGQKPGAAAKSNHSR